MDGPVLVTYDVIIWFKEQSFPSKKQAFIDQVQPLSCRSYRRGSGFLTTPETWHIICLHHLSSKSIINNDTDLQWLNKPSEIRYSQHLIQHFLELPIWSLWESVDSDVTLDMSAPLSSQISRNFTKWPYWTVRDGWSLPRRRTPWRPSTCGTSPAFKAQRWPRTLCPALAPASR